MKTTQYGNKVRPYQAFTDDAGNFTSVKCHRFDAAGTVSRVYRISDIRADGGIREIIEALKGLPVSRDKAHRT